jgi:biopolymer transport protein ExbB/TolQ
MKKLIILIVIPLFVNLVFAGISIYNIFFNKIIKIAEEKTEDIEFNVEVNLKEIDKMLEDAEKELEKYKKDLIKQFQNDLEKNQILEELEQTKIKAIEEGKQIIKNKAEKKKQENLDGIYNSILEHLQ